MSYSDKVANFLEAPTNELDTISMDDLELIAGDVMERVRSQPNSPLGKQLILMKSCFMLFRQVMELVNIGLLVVKNSGIKYLSGLNFLLHYALQLVKWLIDMRLNIYVHVIKWLNK